MSSAKLTADDFLIQVFQACGRDRTEALALLERYAAQVRSEAYEKAAEELPYQRMGAVNDYGDGFNHGIDMAVEFLRRRALAQAPEMKGGE